MKRTQIAPGVHLSYDAAQKFNRCRISIHFAFPARRETANLVFAGTSVSEGNGRVVVTKIGMATEFGKIAGLTQNMEDSESPLQRQLDRLTKQVTLPPVNTASP